jgi:hydroxymethylbilane synthase
VTLRIGTRGSQLALWQANTVARLIVAHGGPPCELLIIRTSGDEKPSQPPDAPQEDTRSTSAAPGTPGPPGTPGTPGTSSTSGPAGTPATPTKTTFVKEIEDALLDGRIDLAVHSSKDLSAVFPAGLTIGATLPREDARDAILLPRGERCESIARLEARLGPHPRFGTSSVRRIAQLTGLFPGASFAAMRGNVDTRLRKLDAGECDAGVLASAGLKRLGLAARISLALPLDICIPAPGQGIVTIQVRDDQAAVKAAVAAINDRDAFDALTAERAIVRSLGGGCQMPLGAHARIEGDDVSVSAVVIAPDGSRVIRAALQGRRTAARDVGERLAEALLQQGAAEILAT